MCTVHQLYKLTTPILWIRFSKDSLREHYDIILQAHTAQIILGVRLQLSANATQKCSYNVYDTTNLCCGALYTKLMQQHAKNNSKARFPLPELTVRVNGRSWQVTGFHYPSTRAVLTGARFHWPSWRGVLTGIRLYDSTGVGNNFSPK